VLPTLMGAPFVLAASGYGLAAHISARPAMMVRDQAERVVTRSAFAGRQRLGELRYVAARSPTNSICVGRLRAAISCHCHRDCT
jgi:hypothetical protein